MKKLFTSLMVLAAAFTASAELTVTGVNDVKYSDGDVINVGYEVTRPGRVGWDPELVAHVTSAGKVTVSATSTVGDYVQFCGIDGQCQMLDANAVEKSGNYSAGNNIPFQIEITNVKEAEINSIFPVKDDKPEPIVVKVTVSQGSESIALTVNFLPMSAEQAGIDAPEVAHSALTVSHRTLSYNVDTAVQLAVYNISGRPVINRRVSGIGSLNLAALPAGVYVYRLGSATGKFLLK